jgi:hypothetical protein
LPRLTEVIRAGEWWEYKLVPIFAAFYGTALTLNVPVAALWPAALMTLLALVPGAAYVSVINDVTDRADDLAAGKANRVAGRSRLGITSFVAIPVLCGLAFSYVWRGDHVLLSLYLAAWLAFSLYSLPPFRFKARGILGVLCDASGAHLFPTLVAVMLAYRGAMRPPETPWLIAVGVWSLTQGLRGILWHQLTDLAHDRKAGVHTFAERHARAAEVLGTWIVFPLELLSLGVMLWRMRTPLPLAFLGIYAYLTFERMRHWPINAVVVKPKPRFLIVMQDYYAVFLPVALLIAARAWIVLAAHLTLFPVRPFQTLHDITKMIRQHLYPST